MISGILICLRLYEMKISGSNETWHI